MHPGNGSAVSASRRKGEASTRAAADHERTRIQFIFFWRIMQVHETMQECNE
jgi:hypothetical protein